jgi:hypothetical protein
MPPLSRAKAIIRGPKHGPRRATWPDALIMVYIGRVQYPYTSKLQRLVARRGEKEWILVVANFQPPEPEEESHYQKRRTIYIVQVVIGAEAFYKKESA